MVVVVVVVVPLERARRKINVCVFFEASKKKMTSYITRTVLLCTEISIQDESIYIYTIHHVIRVTCTCTTCIAKRLINI